MIFPIFGDASTPHVRLCFVRPSNRIFRIFHHVDNDYCRCIQEFVRGMSGRPAFHSLVYWERNKTSRLCVVSDVPILFVDFTSHFCQLCCTSSPALVSTKCKKWMILPLNVLPLCCRTRSFGRIIFCNRILLVCFTSVTKLGSSDS